MLFWLNTFAALSLSWLLLHFFLTSLWERELRAAVSAGLGLCLNGLFWLWILFGGGPLAHTVSILVLAAAGVFAILSLIPYFPDLQRPKGEISPYDEREHMFSRMHLANHPELAKRYYARHPEQKAQDEKLRAGTLTDSSGTFYDPCFSKLPEAAFAFLADCHSFVAGEPAAHSQPNDAAAMTRHIQEVARYYGAADTGVTRLLPHHLYSHYGRKAENWGQPVETDHRYAIAMVTPMRIAMIKQSPTLPSLLESSRQYVEAGKAALVLAEYIRRLGYAARAHIDCNYQVVCVPVAADAGLGEVSRMGLLLHPVLGPCLRIAVVTTTMPLKETKKEYPHIRHFCRICKKCADNCPSQAVPGGDMPFSRGIRHWHVAQEKCYAFWRRLGTDCAFCIRVCPYTKPNTLVHRLVRFYISRNPINQRIALFFDDLFYRRKLPLKRANPSPLIR